MCGTIRGAQPKAVMQVCNGHEDTVAHMTTPAEMRADILATLAFLDTYTRARARAPVVLEHSSDRAVKSSLCTATHVRGLKGQGGTRSTAKCGGGSSDPSVFPFNAMHGCML